MTERKAECAARSLSSLPATRTGLIWGSLCTSALLEHRSYELRVVQRIKPLSGRVVDQAQRYFGRRQPGGALQNAPAPLDRAFDFGGEVAVFVIEVLQPKARMERSGIHFPTSGCVKPVSAEPFDYGRGKLQADMSVGVDEIPPVQIRALLGKPDQGVQAVGLNYIHRAAAGLEHPRDLAEQSVFFRQRDVPDHVRSNDAVKRACIEGQRLEIRLHGQPVIPGALDQSRESRIDPHTPRRPFRKHLTSSRA